jgi:hypothetical protein
MLDLEDRFLAAHPDEAECEEQEELLDRCDREQLSAERELRAELDAMVLAATWNWDITPDDVEQQVRSRIMHHRTKQMWDARLRLREISRPRRNPCRLVRVRRPFVRGAPRARRERRHVARSTSSSDPGDDGLDDGPAGRAGPAGSICAASGGGR